MTRALCLLLLGSACAQVKPTIKAQPFDLGGVRASVREFPGASICDAEPRFLIDELASVNGLLRHVVQTLPSADAELTDGAIALVEESVERLPVLLASHEKSLTSLQRCSFAATGAWPGLIARGRELMNETRARLEAAPGQLQAAKQARVVEAWRRERLSQQVAATRACAPKKGAVVSFAWTEGATTTWLFCDGAQVTRVAGQAPVLERPLPELSRGRPVKDAAYLSAVERYPTASVFPPPQEEVLSVW